jgi:hypothetical protein
MLFKCANAQAHSAKSVPPGRALDLSLLSVGCPNINLFVDFPNLLSSDIENRATSDIEK